MKYLTALIAVFLPASAAMAANDVALNSSVFVEKTVQEANGRTRIVLEPPALVVPGDKLLFVLNYKNGGAKPATDFTVTNPMPGAVAFTGSETDGALVSVDGGKSWGALAMLKVSDQDGIVRTARPEDVTHVRWVLRNPIPSGQGGKLSFRGVVR
jgi:hypothetical protein